MVHSKTKMLKKNSQFYMVTKGDRSGKGMDWELEIGMYTLLHLKHTTNKDRLYSTGNSSTIVCNNLNGKKT